MAPQNRGWAASGLDLSSMTPCIAREDRDPCTALGQQLAQRLFDPVRRERRMPQGRKQRRIAAIARKDRTAGRQKSVAATPHPTPPALTETGSAQRFLLSPPRNLGWAPAMHPPQTARLRHTETKTKAVTKEWRANPRRRANRGDDGRAGERNGNAQRQHRLASAFHGANECQKLRGSL